MVGGSIDLVEGILVGGCEAIAFVEQRLHAVGQHGKFHGLAHGIKLPIEFGQMLKRPIVFQVADTDGFKHILKFSRIIFPIVVPIPYQRELIKRETERQGRLRLGERGSGSIDAIRVVSRTGILLRVTID